MPRLKIAMLAACPFPWARGTPARVLRLSEALCERGHEVHVVTYHLGDRSVALPFQVHRIPRLPTYRKTAPGPSLQKLALLDPLLALTLRRVLRQERIDVIHAHHYEGLLVSAWAQMGTARLPIVYDAHTTLESELPSYGPPLAGALKARVGREIDRWLPGRAGHIVAVTEQIRERLVQVAGVPAGRVTVAPNGVELERFAQSRSARRRGGDGAGQVYTLGYAGNLAPYQGIDLLLLAAKKVLDVRRDVRLVVATGSPTAKWEAEARRLGIGAHVEFANPDLDALPGVLAGFDVALNSRPYCDGIPSKLLNYMAAGKPIVSFQGSARGVREDALLAVPGEAAEAFAAAVLRLLDEPDLARCLGERALRAAMEDHSWARTAEIVEGVYMRTLGRTNKAEGIAS
ncbi:MAG TPA: glycosyltransferase family 4 protein [Chloroflexia bacterium]|nr:glycosyltransferase family 4 protein [Chloroflexia bacterium]